MNLFEAFDKLKTLDEETFDVSKDGIEKLQEFENDDYTDELIDIYDADLDDEDDDECDCECHDHKDDVILDCSVCHSKVYKDKKDVKLDEEADLANVGDECPYCHSNDGYEVVGQVKECDMKEGKEGVCPECGKPIDKCVCKNVNEAVATSAPSIGKVLSKHADEINQEYEPTKVKAKVKEILDNSEIAGTPAVETFKDRLDQMRTSTSLFNLIGTYLTNTSTTPKGLSKYNRYKDKDESLIRESEESEDKIRQKYKKAKDAGDIDKAEKYKWDFVDEKIKGLKSKKDESLREDYRTATKFYDDNSGDTFSFVDVMQDFIDNYSMMGYKPNLQSFISYVRGGLGKGSAYTPVEESLKEDNLGQDVEKYQRWVDYDMKKYKNISDQTNRKIKEAGLQLVKDQYGDYEVTAGNDSISESGNIKESVLKRRFLHKLSEALDELEVKTGDMKLEVTSDENGKVTVNAEPKEAELEDSEEVIEPVSPETEMEIEGDFEKPVEETEFDEESFDEVAESYLKKIDESVASYKTRKVFTNKKNNRLVIEGVICGKDKSRKSTRFVFESFKPLTSGKFIMTGLNESLAKGTNKPYRLFVKNADKKIVVEGMKYKHSQKSKIGKTTVVEGFVKRGK